MARLIDADATIDRYYAEWEYHCIKMGEDDRQWLRQCIDQAPTIEAKPVVHGEIIETIEKGKMKRVFSCCNTVCTQLTMWLMPNYCPNCGAEMRERINKHG